MRKETTPHYSSARPTEEDIRDYAFHLYVQDGCVPGRDLDHWLEAESCLRADIPKEHTRLRLHRHIHHN